MPKNAALGRIDTADAFRNVFRVSRETTERLIVYEALVRTWQKAVNLVSPATLDDIWHRHMADSAQLLDLALSELHGASALPRPGRPFGGSEGAPGVARTDGENAFPLCDSPKREEEKGPPTAAAGKSWLDLGSGGGFPGLVLAIMLAERDPQVRVTLVESDSRKAAFLREVARKTGVVVEIRAERSENCATQAKSQIREAITARALAPLPKLLGLVLPFFSPQTVALFPKGREASVEVEEAKRRFDFDCQLVPSLTDAEARVVIVRNLAVNTEG